MVQSAGFDFRRFRQEMQGAARGNQFRIDITAPLSIRPFIPQSLVTEESLSFKAKSGSIPPKDINVINLPFRGRQMKIAGDRELQPFTTSVYLTDGLPERKFFETWQDAILGFDDASRLPDADVDYTSDITIHQLNQNGVIQVSYVFEDAWPQAVGEVAFDAEAGEVLMCDITFEMNNIRTLGIR